MMMKMSEQRHAELEEEFYEEWHPGQGTNMLDMLVHKIVKLEAENCALREAITDGRLTHIHFMAWANQIANEKGYSGSEIEVLCLRLADILLTEESDD